MAAPAEKGGTGRRRGDRAKAAAGGSSGRFYLQGLANEVEYVRFQRTLMKRERVLAMRVEGALEVRAPLSAEIAPAPLIRPRVAGPPRAAWQRSAAEAAATRAKQRAEASARRTRAAWHAEATAVAPAAAAAAASARGVPPKPGGASARDPGAAAAPSARPRPQSAAAARSPAVSPVWPVQRLDLSRTRNTEPAAGGSWGFSTGRSGTSRSSAAVFPAPAQATAIAAEPLFETLKGLWLSEHARRRQLRAQTAELHREVRSLRAQLSALLPRRAHVVADVTIA